MALQQVMVSPEELVARQKELDDLGCIVEDAQQWVSGVLDALGWTQEHLLQKDEDLSVCPHDSGHLVPTTCLEKHSQECALLKQGYTKEDIVKLKEPDNFYNKSTAVGSIHIDDETFFQILESVQGNQQPGSGRKRCQPLTVERETIDLTREERLAIYEYCIRQVKSEAKPTSLTEDGLLLLEDDKSKGKNEQGLTIMEQRALERDMKRRRQAYRGKSTHTSKHSQIEILREVIETQTDILTRMWNERKEPTHAVEDKDRSDAGNTERHRHSKSRYGHRKSKCSRDSRSPEELRRTHSPRMIKEENPSFEMKSHKHKKHKKHKNKDRKRSRSRNRSRSRGRSRSHDRERPQDRSRSRGRSKSTERVISYDR